MTRQSLLALALVLLIFFSNFVFINRSALGDVKAAANVSVDSKQSAMGLFPTLNASVGDDSSETATVYTSSGEVETVHIPSSSFQSTLSVGSSRTVFVNDVRSGDKLDESLNNLSLLVKENYIQNDDIPVIALVGDKMTSNAYDLHPLESTQLNEFKTNLTMFNATFQTISSQLPFVKILLPYKYIFDVAQQANIGHLFLDRQFHVCLNESVSIVKPPAEWRAIEQSYGHAINGSGVRIAILDTGIDQNHPDLMGKVVLAKSFTGESPEDGFGHGTHCASIAAGTGAASNGTFKGVAPGALLLNGKVLSNSGSGMEDWVIAGVAWAVNNSAKVISMSLGSSDYNDGSDPLSLALDWASQNGVLCAVAAGNSGEDGMKTIGSPGTSREAITVGATNKNDTIAFFSSQGLTADLRLKPDICAPGVDIIAARANGTAMGSVVNKYYTEASGTSMATPFVSGAAALIIQVHPSWTPMMIKAALMGNAKPLNGERLWREGAGRMDICGAVMTKAVITPPSGSFAFLKAGTKSQLNFTIINTTPTVLYTAYHVNVRCNGTIVLNCASLNVTGQYLGPNGLAGLSVEVGPAQMSNIGWWEISLNVTMPLVSPPQSIVAPCVAYSGADVTTRVFDEGGNLNVLSYFLLCSFPERNLIEFQSGLDLGYAHFSIKPGTYSFVIVFPFVSGYMDDNYRSCMAEKVVNVPFGQTYLNFSLSNISKHVIQTKDVHGQVILIHSYKESISGGPFYNRTTGVTSMNWTLETEWSSSEDPIERESRLYPLNSMYQQEKPMILYSDFNDSRKFSTEFGYYGSNDVFSEVYLLVWKYDNQTIPAQINQSFDDLAKYKIYYGFPEGFPVRVEIASYVDFQPNVTNPFLITHTKHVVSAGINATYYMTPEIAFYRGVYYIEYGMWMGSVWCIRPGQTWRIPTPAPRETGYIHLGDYKFGPYTPGMTLKTTRIGSNSTISLTGDLWSNLKWPDQWDMFWGDDCTQNLLGEYPPPYNSNYTLYVDGGQVANGSLVRDGYYTTIWDSRFGFRQVPQSKVWNNMTLSWNVTGQRAKIIMDLPGMTSPNQAIYQAEFRMNGNSTLAPFFNMSLAPMNYSAGDTLTLNPQLRSDIVNATLEYSFDSGATWTLANHSEYGFEIPCQNKCEMAIRINAEDSNGSKFLYCCSPFAYCKDVNFEIQNRADSLSINVTDVEGRSLNRVPCFKFALECRLDNNVTYLPVFDNGTIIISKPLPFNVNTLTISFLGLGIYGKNVLTLQRIPGDVNGDMSVNVLDLILIANHLGHHATDHAPYSLDWYTFNNCDLNGDGQVNVLDLITCAGHLGQSWS